MPSDAAGFEQTIGRFHREGQVKDECEVHIYQHTPELVDAMEKAEEKAAYIHQTQNPQKLCYGAWGDGW